MGKRKTNEEYIEEVSKIHGGHIDFSKVEYTGRRGRILLACNDCGYVWETRADIILGGCGCPECYHRSRFLTLEEFVKKSREKHGDKYDYSKVTYNGVDDDVIIICPKHGEFKQKAGNHLNGEGCLKCKIDRQIEEQTLTTEEFIVRANIVHNGKYDYSNVKYIRSKTPVCIICPKHGEFWQRPGDHLNGCGCEKCKSSKLEIDVRNMLSSNKIHFEEQKKFEWLNRQRLDFFINDANIAIECQGIQHFVPIDFFGGENGFAYSKKRDNKKKNLCRNNNIEILYYSTCKESLYNNEENCFNDINLLLNEIKSRLK